MFIYRRQAVRRVHHFPRIFGCLGPLRRAGIYLGVQVQTRQQKPCRCLIGAAVGVRLRVFHRFGGFEQLFFDEPEEFGTLYLRGILGRYLRYERYFSKHVDQVAVVQGTHKTRFGTLYHAFSVAFSIGLFEEEVA